jgi:sec-independent protein translocase protein TatB
MHISFSEILVILLVALLVIKPEQLPGAAFALGKWVKWLQQIVTHVKREIAEPLSSDHDHERK